jgi:polyhydroxyalkanoate synthesis repressor PhaR
MGGQVALRLALMSPEKVKSLALIAPAGIETFSASESAWLKKMSTAKGFASRGPSALRAHFKRNIFGRWGHIAEEHLQERIKLRDAPGFYDYIQAVVSSINGMLDDRVAYELGRVKPPVYLLFGEKDRLIPNPVLHGGRVQDIIQRAQRELKSLVQVELLPEVGHMPQVEAPHRTNRLILSAASLKRVTAPHTYDTSAHSARSLTMKPILIKRYPNRRLYDTGRSAYVTLDELAEDLSTGRRIRVQDNKSGEDITRKVLMQALLTEGQQHKLNCIPQDFLFTLLQLEDQTTLTLFSQYVRATLSSFSIAQNAMSQNMELMKRLAPQPTELISQIGALFRAKGPQDKG